MLMPSDKISSLLLHPDQNSADSLPEAPPAPPPIQPLPAQNNPYDFITNPSKPARKSLLPGGKMGRIIIVGAGAAIIIMVGVIVAAVISSSGADLKTDYLSLAQQQTELIRVSDIGVTKARQTNAKNLAITTQYSLSSQQQEILALAKKAGAATDAKTLAAGKDDKTDALLTSADQANQFDDVFAKTLKALLQKYRLTLKKIYDATDSTSTKTTLSKNYEAVDRLVSSQ